MRRFRTLLAIALVAGACGGGASEATPEPASPTVETTTTTATAVKSDPAATTTTTLPPAAATTEVAGSQPASMWPTARIHPTLLPDPMSGRMLMVGGLSRMGRVMDLRDAWLLNTLDFEWTHLADGAPRDAFNFGIDTESAQVVAFNLMPAETWTLDIAAGEWRQQTPAEQPESTSTNPRFGTPLTYDAESDRLILFAGGSPWHMYTDTWAYDANTATWELMAPESSPTPRAMYATAYDAESDRVLLWGGFTGTDENDVQMWAYDYNTDTWEALPNPDGPQQHAERHGMAYIPAFDKTLLYSGMLEDEGVLPAATWYYDYNTNTWTELVVETSPPALAMYGMAYDDATATVVLYGGEMTSKNAGNLSRDVWVFDPATDNWAKIPSPEQ